MLHQSIAENNVEVVHGEQLIGVWKLVQECFGLLRALRGISIYLSICRLRLVGDVVYVWNQLVHHLFFSGLTTLLAKTLSLRHRWNLLLDRCIHWNGLAAESLWHIVRLHFYILHVFTYFKNWLILRLDWLSCFLIWSLKTLRWLCIICPAKFLETLISSVHCLLLF